MLLCKSESSVGGLPCSPNCIPETWNSAGNRTEILQFFSNAAVVVMRTVTCLYVWEEDDEEEEEYTHTPLCEIVAHVACMREREIERERESV